MQLPVFLPAIIYAPSFLQPITEVSIPDLGLSTTLIKCHCSSLVQNSAIWVPR